MSKSLEPICVKCGDDTVSLESVAVNHPGDLRLMCASCRKTHFEPLPPLRISQFLSAVGHAFVALGVISVAIAIVYFVELSIRGQ